MFMKITKIELKSSKVLNKTLTGKIIFLTAIDANPY